MPGGSSRVSRRARCKTTRLGCWRTYAPPVASSLPLLPLLLPPLVPALGLGLGLGLLLLVMTFWSLCWEGWTRLRHLLPLLLPLLPLPLLLLLWLLLLLLQHLPVPLPLRLFLLLHLHLPPPLPLRLLLLPQPVIRLDLLRHSLSSTLRMCQRLLLLLLPLRLSLPLRLCLFLRQGLHLLAILLLFLRV